MEINLEDDSTRSIHKKINEYLQKCAISKAEFTVSNDGKTAHLISYKTEPKLCFWLRLGGWFVSRLDIILIAVIIGVVYWRVSSRVDSMTDTNRSAALRSFAWESNEHTSASCTVGKDIALEEVFISRCGTNTVSTLPTAK